MKKEELIERYGEAAYEKKLEQTRAWNKAHRAEMRASDKKYKKKHPEVSKKYREEHREEAKAATKEHREENPEKVKLYHQEQSRKGGKHYDKMLEYKRTGLQGERNRIRMNHAYKYHPYKAIIAPDSQLHHEWVPETAEYRGVALVETDAHRHGFVDVIEILDGEITLLTEEEVKMGKKK